MVDGNPRVGIQVLVGVHQVAAREADRDRRVGRIEAQQVVVVPVPQVRERRRGDLALRAVRALHGHAIERALGIACVVAIRPPHAAGPGHPNHLLHAVRTVGPPVPRYHLRQHERGAGVERRDLRLRSAEVHRATRRSVREQVVDNEHLHRRVVVRVAELTDEKHGPEFARIVRGPERDAHGSAFGPGPRDDPEVLGLQGVRVHRMRQHDRHAVLAGCAQAEDIGPEGQAVVQPEKGRQRARRLAVRRGRGRRRSQADRCQAHCGNVEAPIHAVTPCSDAWTARVRPTVRGSSSPTICILFMT